MVVDGDASAPYVPNPRALPAGTKVGFAEGWAAIPFSFSINKHLYELAAELGFEVVYCDIEFDAEKAVSCAEQIVSQGPDFAINSNWQAGAATAVAAVYDGGQGARAVHRRHPPQPDLPGRRQLHVGLHRRQGRGRRRRRRSAAAPTPGILLGENPGEGAGADQRLAGFADGVQTVCGAIPAERIAARSVRCRAPAEQALTKATDWLTAHPDGGLRARRPPSTTRARTASPRRSPRAGATATRSGSAATTSAQASTKASATEANHFLGCVAYFPERYPDYAISIAADMLEGKPVPQEVHLEHVFLDHATIGSVYP